MSKLTVGELKKALENVPDDLEVELRSDSGVDQSDDGCDVIVEDAYRHTIRLHSGGTFENYFVIYANYRDKDEEDEEEES